MDATGYDRGDSILQHELQEGGANDWGEPWKKPPADPHDFLPHIETCTKCGECRQALDAQVI